MNTDTRQVKESVRPGPEIHFKRLSTAHADTWVNRREERVSIDVAKNSSKLALVRSVQK